LHSCTVSSYSADPPNIYTVSSTRQALWYPLADIVPVTCFGWTHAEVAVS
jgi:hypothetical protein